MKYAVVIERTNTNFSAYVPDLPGCIATGETREEVELSMREAIQYHIEGMKQYGQPIPIPSSVVEYVEVAA
jgi:predicted RNase H-like HicB family nuclease